MKTMTVFAAAALALAGTAGAVYAQPYDNGYYQGSPGLREQIERLQQRIDSGRADGSLDPEEARRSQLQLNDLRRQAQDLQARLNSLSRSIQWRRHNDDNGYVAPGGNAYGTNYDAYRYYREEPTYRETRLGPNDEVYRGSDGRYYCRRNDGTVGLVIGAVGGAALGNVIDGGRNRVAGTLIGGALGALIGKSVDQSSSDLRCR